MSMPTSEDPFAGLRSLLLDKEDDIPQHDKTLGDLPPEVKSIILEHLTWNEKRRILGYRLVNSQWNDIICSRLQKRITSGHLPAFPVMRVLCTGVAQDLLHVRYLPTMFPAGQNPFPSNSLVLRGVAGKTNPNYFPAPDVDVLWMALPDFMPSFGGNLTTFELQNVVVPGMNSVITLLSSMPFLRNLTLKDVRLNDRIMKPKVVLPTPPPLSNLKILSVKASRQFYWDNLSEKTDVLIVYLIASYAEQLVHLNLETYFSLQALQQCHQYSCPLDDSSETFPIATTSSSAFANLKELNVKHPTGSFFRLSEIPSLQQLSVNGLQSDQEGQNVVDLVNFVVKYEANLQQLRLNVYWSDLMGIDDGAQPEPILGLSRPVRQSNIPGLSLEVIGHKVKLNEVELLYFQFKLIA